MSHTLFERLPNAQIFIHYEKSNLAALFLLPYIEWCNAGPPLHAVFRFALSSQCFMPASTPACIIFILIIIPELVP